MRRTWCRSTNPGNRGAQRCWPKNRGGYPLLIREVLTSNMIERLRGRIPGKAVRRLIVKTPEEWELALEELKKEAEKVNLPNGVSIVGFDTEGVTAANFNFLRERDPDRINRLTPVCYRNLEDGRTCMIQISTLTGITVIVRLCDIGRSLPQSLNNYLADPDIFKVGVALDGDAEQLGYLWGCRLRSWVDARHLVVYDLPRFIKERRPVDALNKRLLTEGSSLKAIAKAVFGPEVLPFANERNGDQKRKRVSWSFWADPTLSESQLTYAEFDSQIAADMVNLLAFAIECNDDNERMQLHMKLQLRSEEQYVCPGTYSSRKENESGFVMRDVLESFERGTTAGTLTKKAQLFLSHVEENFQKPEPMTSPTFVGMRRSLEFQAFVEQGRFGRRQYEQHLPQSQASVDSANDDHMKRLTTSAQPTLLRAIHNTIPHPTEGKHCLRINTDSIMKTVGRHTNFVMGLENYNYGSVEGTVSQYFLEVEKCPYVYYKMRKSSVQQAPLTATGDADSIHAADSQESDGDEPGGRVGELDALIATLNSMDEQAKNAMEIWLKHEDVVDATDDEIDQNIESNELADKKEEDKVDRSIVETEEEQVDPSVVHPIFQANILEGTDSLPDCVSTLDESDEQATSEDPIDWKKAIEEHGGVPNRPFFDDPSFLEGLVIPPDASREQRCQLLTQYLLEEQRTKPSTDAHLAHKKSADMTPTERRSQLIRRFLSTYGDPLFGEILRDDLIENHPELKPLLAEIEQQQGGDADGATDESSSPGVDGGICDESEQEEEWVWMRRLVSLSPCWSCGCDWPHQLYWEPIVPGEYLRMYKTHSECFCNYAKLCYRCLVLWRCELHSLQMEMAMVFDAPIDTPPFVLDTRVEKAFVNVALWYDYESALGEEMERRRENRDYQVNLPCTDGEAKAAREYVENFLSDVASVTGISSSKRRGFSRHAGESSIHHARRLKDYILSELWFVKNSNHPHAYKVIVALGEDIPQLEYMFRRRFKESMGRSRFGFFPANFREWHGCMMDRCGWSIVGSEARPADDGQPWSTFLKKEEEETQLKAKIEKAKKKFESMTVASPNDASATGGPSGWTSAPVSNWQSHTASPGHANRTLVPRPPPPFMQQMTPQNLSPSAVGEWTPNTCTSPPPVSAVREPMAAASVPPTSAGEFAAQERRVRKKPIGRFDAASGAAESFTKVSDVMAQNRQLLSHLDAEEKSAGEKLVQQFREKATLPQQDISSQSKPPFRGLGGIGRGHPLNKS